MIGKFIAICFIGIGIYYAIDKSYSRIERDEVDTKYITAKQRMMELECLADNIYYEAAGEDFESKVAVAQVTLNRTKSSKFPNDICRVVYQKSQFSWTISKPRSLVKRHRKAYNESYEVAKLVLLEGFRLKSVKDAQFYHATWMDRYPVWAEDMKKVAVIGQHVFYKN